MTFAIKGQTKAAAAFKGNFGIYGPILFKLWVEVAYWHSFMFCKMAFTIKGQTKAAVAFKGKFGVYGLILLKLCMQVAYFSPRKTCSMAFTMKGQTKATVAFKGNAGVYWPILFKLCIQAQWEESFFTKISVAIVILFWLKWAGYLSMAGLNRLAQLSDRISPSGV